jgi:hypothetical protein
VNDINIKAAALADAYRAHRKNLKEFHRKHFDFNTPVIVNCPGRYVGRGVVGMSEDCRVDHVPVLCPSGNIWHYPIETVTPVTI